MYIPSAFRVRDESTLFDAIERWNFGLLVNPDGHGGVDATHIPFLLDREERRLYTHLAAANPHVHSLDDARVTAVFRGPHAHVSPLDLGDARRNVPTWNYIAVHAEGTARRLVGPEAVTTLARIVTAEEGEAWSADDMDPTLYERLLDAIAVFAIDIDGLEGAWKLSQNKDAGSRERVIQALRERGYDDAVGIADAMSGSGVAG